MTPARTRLRRETRIVERLAGAALGLVLTGLIAALGASALVAVELLGAMVQREGWR